MSGEADRDRWLPWALVGGLTLAGLLLRMVLFQQSAFGDEMSTLWIVKGNDLAGTVSAVYSDAEISPPLYFVLAELFTVFGETIDAIRLPSVIAGVASIPLYFLIGRKAIGRRAAYYAAAVATASPFLVYFSANARAYSVMIFLLLLATLALVHASSDGARWWHWLGWAVAGCLAVYSHYTAVLVLAGQALWVLCFFPALRLKIIGWSVVAALLFVPWAWGLRADLNSPTIDILQGLQEGGLGARWDATQQVLFLRVTSEPWSLFFDRPDIMLGAIGLVVAVTGAIWRVAKGTADGPAKVGRNGTLLAAFMTFSVVGGELLLLALGTDIYGVRNLAPVLAGLPLLIGALCAAAGAVTGPVSIALIVTGLLVSTAYLADSGNTTIDYKSAAELIEGRETDRGVVLDGSVLSPAPQTPLDAYLDTDMEVVRLTAIEDRPDFIEHVYDTFDPQEITDEAFSGPGPVELVTLGAERAPVAAGGGGGTRYTFQTDFGQALIPPGWEQVGQTRFDGLQSLVVTRFERTGKPGGDSG